MDAVVSVIIPTFNRRRFISETVDSVLAQTYREIEVVVVDDGSTDGTGELLKSRYSNEPRFRYIWQPNAERAVARNAGIRESRGDYIAFLDSDDRWLPTKLEKQMGLLSSHPEMVMALTWHECIDEHGERLGPKRDPSLEDVMDDGFCWRLVYGNRIGSPTPVISRRVLAESGLFCEDRRLICVEDWEMWTRVSCFGRVGLVPEILAQHRLHPGNTEKPVTPKMYLQVVSCLVQRMRPPLARLVLEAASKSYWNRLVYAPPGRLRGRLGAVLKGLTLLRADFLKWMVRAPWRDTCRYFLGEAVFKRLSALYRAARNRMWLL